MDRWLEELVAAVQARLTAGSPYRDIHFFQEQWTPGARFGRVRRSPVPKTTAIVIS